MTYEATLSDRGAEAGLVRAPGDSEPEALPETPFHDLDHFNALPRLTTLVLSPDGTRLITAASTLNSKGTEYSSALWEVDPSARRTARRLTRSAKGEANAAFLPDGDLLFTSARPDPDGDDDD